MGPVLVLLTEPDPVRWMPTVGTSDAGRRAEEIRARWEPTRALLADIAVSYPTHAVRKNAGWLEVALHNSVLSSSEFGRTSTFVANSPWTYDRAKADHSEAQRLANDLAAILRSQSSQPPKTRFRRGV
jgi:hypothetical protein